MKCTILHDTAGRLRVHLCCKRMTLRQADVLEYYLLAVDGVRFVKVSAALLLAEARGGKLADILLYAVAHAIIFGLAGLFLTIYLDRMMRG